MGDHNGRAPPRRLRWTRLADNWCLPVLRLEYVSLQHDLPEETLLQHADLLLFDQLQYGQKSHNDFHTSGLFAEQRTKTQALPGGVIPQIAQPCAHGLDLFSHRDRIGLDTRDWRCGRRLRRDS